MAERSGFERLQHQLLGEVVARITGGDVGAKAEMFEQAADSMAEIVNADKVGSLTPTEHKWITVNDTTFVHSDAGTSDDPHTNLLVRDSDNQFVWHFWVMCPIRRMSVPITLFGDQKRAMHRADVMIDMGNDLISKETLWVASGRKMPGGGAGAAGDGEGATTGRTTSSTPNAEEVAKAAAAPPPGKSPITPDPAAKSRVTPFAEAPAQE